MSGWATPGFNAMLNVTSALFLVAGWRLILARRIAAHRACMLAAATASACFFASYLTYHARVGSVHFTGEGWVRPVYFAILISHTVLAVAIVPVVLRVFWLAFIERWASHVAWARWTAPAWLYVSVSGVIVYWMLYQNG